MLSSHPIIESTCLSDYHHQLRSFNCLERYIKGSYILLVTIIQFRKLLCGWALYSICYPRQTIPLWFLAGPPFHFIFWKGWIVVPSSHVTWVPSFIFCISGKLKRIVLIHNCSHFVGN